MKMITFNIRCSDDPDGHSIVERAPRLKKILEKCDADVVGVQEVRQQWKDILERDYAEDYEIYTQFRSKDKNREGCALLWRKGKFTLLDKGCFWFSKTPWVESLGDDCLYHLNRICQWVQLQEKETGEVSTCLNLHFGFGDTYQVESVTTVRQTVEALQAKRAVIMGDFNMVPDAPGYREMAGSFTDCNAVTQRYSGNTFHNYQRGGGMHIDYCFVNKGFLPKSWQLLDETFEGKYPSDHYGILTELEYAYEKADI